MVLLHVVYQGEIVALCASLAFLGTFCAVSLMEQYRLFTSYYNSPISLLLLAFTAGAHGALSMWCLHFVAICSFRLRLPDGTDVPFRFNLSLLIVIVVVNIIIQYICFHVSSTDQYFNKSKKEIIEGFISRTTNSYTMAQIKQMSKNKLMFLICSDNMWKIIFGGVFSAFGSTLVVYLSFRSMEFQGHVRYNPGLVALLAILNSAFGCNGFVTFFRMLTIFPSLDSLRVGVSANSMIFLTGVSYFGINTVTFEYDPLKAPPSIHNTIQPEQLVIGVMTAAILYATITQVFVISDLRGWLLRTSGQLRQADLVVDAVYKENLSSRRSTPAGREVLRYLRKFNHNGQFVGGAGCSTEENSESALFAHHPLLYNDYSDDEENSEGKRSNQSNNSANLSRPSSEDLRIKPSGSSTDVINVRNSSQVACDVPLVPVGSDSVELPL